MEAVTTSPFRQQRKVKVTEIANDTNMGAGEGTRPYVFALNFVFKPYL